MAYLDVNADDQQREAQQTLQTNDHPDPTLQMRDQGYH